MSDNSSLCFGQCPAAFDWVRYKQLVLEEKEDENGERAVVTTQFFETLSQTELVDGSWSDDAKSLLTALIEKQTL